MLVEFTVRNYRSFKEPQTLSLEATDDNLNIENLVEEGELRLLKSVGIFGANSSGKSNLLKALFCMVEIIKHSALSLSYKAFKSEPFALVTGFEDKPTLFELVFIVNKETFKYGFEIIKYKVLKEYLYKIEPIEKEIFERIDQKITLCEELNEVEFLTRRTKETSLFISILEQFNMPEYIKAIWPSLTEFKFYKFPYNDYILDTTPPTEELKLLLKKLDLDLDNVGHRKVIYQKENGRTNSVLIPTSEHKVYDEKGNKAGQKEFDLEDFESEGVKKLYDLGAYVLKVLKEGQILIVDEIEKNLHLFQTLHLIYLFNSEENTNGAQLIFSSHDTNLLSRGNLRRDQIYFTEKNKVEATELYTLAQFKLDKKTNYRRKKIISMVDMVQSLLLEVIVLNYERKICKKTN